MPTEDMTTIIDHDQFQSESRLDAIESRLKHQEEKLKDLDECACTSHEGQGKFQVEVLGDINSINERISCMKKQYKELESQIAITSATLKGFLAGYEMRDK